MVLRGQTLARSTYYVAAALNVMTFASNQAIAQCVVQRWTTASLAPLYLYVPKTPSSIGTDAGMLAGGRQPRLLLSERFTQAVAFFEQVGMHAL